MPSERSWECKEAHNLEDMMNMSHPFINYKKKLIFLGGNQAPAEEGSSRSYEKESKKHKEKGDLGPRSRIANTLPSTPLGKQFGNNLQTLSLGK